MRKIDNKKINIHMFFKPSMLFLDETDDTVDARGRYETYLSVSLLC